MPVENTKKNKELRKAKAARRIMLHVPYYVRLGYDSKTQYRNHRNHRKAIKAFREPVVVQDGDDFSDLTEV